MLLFSANNKYPNFRWWKKFWIRTQFKINEEFMTLKLPNSEKIIVARFSSFDLKQILLFFKKKKIPKNYWQSSVIQGDLIWNKKIIWKKKAVATLIIHDLTYWIWISKGFVWSSIGIVILIGRINEDINKRKRFQKCQKNKKNHKNHNILL